MRLARLTLLALLLPLAAGADVDFGIAVGQPGPDFVLADQHGAQQSLADLRESGPVALLFYRSGDW